MLIKDKLTLEQVQGSYFKICGQSYFDLSSIFAIDQIKSDEHQCSFTLSSKFDTSVQKVIRIDVSDVFLSYLKKEKQLKNDLTDVEKNFSQKIVDELNDFVENEVIPIMLSQK